MRRSLATLALAATLITSCEGGSTDHPAKLAPGEPCAAPAECASGLCGGYGGATLCLAGCEGSGCAADQDCLPAPGAAGDATQPLACLPADTVSCAPCEDDLGCAGTYAAACLADSTGATFCARTCEHVGCAEGQECVEVSGVLRCLPADGLCVCEPAGADEPDGAFADTNCDGIDGDAGASIFVAAASGDDAGACGATAAAPCRTIGRGLARATEAGRSAVLVMAGTYPELVRLPPGLTLAGGYDTAWRRAAASTPGHLVTITGGYDAGAGAYVTLLAVELAEGARVLDLRVAGPDASGAGPGGEGRSSIAVVAADATLSLERVTIVAGRGAPGAAGQAGADAPALTAAPAGTAGTDAGAVALCSTDRTAPGSPGLNACGDGRSTAGGGGGQGGASDSACAFPADPAAEPGLAGADAGTFVSGGPGARGPGGPLCGAGSPAADGAVTDGAGGVGGAGGELAGLAWRARGGASGGVGAHGGGGGGGGGSGGCDDANSAGAGGGGGGAGGCAALSGGGGGGGGGGSLGVLAISATLSMEAVAITRGAAGDGGGGGAGGRGQPGGAGGAGGLAGGASLAGGRGGDGGRGGHGGGGGGGAGGLSAGIVAVGSVVTAGAAVSGGSPGAGGEGGASFGGAGLDGAAGQLAGTLTCASATSCP